MKIFIWISIFLITITLIAFMAGCGSRDEPSSRKDKEDEYPRSPLPGFWHTVGLKSDGTVVATGANTDGQLNINDWTDIVQIYAGSASTMGLKSDGTVIAVGWNYSGQLDIEDWTEIIQVGAYRTHTMGLKSDGTVVIAGTELSPELFKEFKDIIQIDGFAGLKSDGTVVTIEDGYMKLDVGVWTDIIQVAAGGGHLVGLKSDGTAIAETRRDDHWHGGDYGQLNVGDWTNIIQVAAGNNHTVGLKSDGTVVAVGYNEAGECEVKDWTDIIQISAASDG